MIVVAVADDRVFDLLRIEPELPQSLDDLVVDRVVENRVDENEAVGGLDGPGGVFALTDEVEIVEDLHRLRMPLGPRRRSLRPRTWRGARLPPLGGWPRGAPPEG